jgi:hypothetical protein
MVQKCTETHIILAIDRVSAVHFGSRFAWEMSLLSRLSGGGRYLDAARAQSVRMDRRLGRPDRVRDTPGANVRGGLGDHGVAVMTFLD